MPNHVHLILVLSDPEGLRRALARAPQLCRDHSGATQAHRTLLARAFGAVAMDDHYLAAALHATEAVAEKTGDAVGGLLNATLGNQSFDRRCDRDQRALHARRIAVLGGLRHRVQAYNRAGGRLHSVATPAGAQSGRWLDAAPSKRGACAPWPARVPLRAIRIAGRSIRSKDFGKQLIRRAKQEHDGIISLRAVAATGLAGA